MLNTLLLGLPLLCGAIATPCLQHNDVNHKLDVDLQQPKLATYDDEDYTITLTADELNNYVFTNFEDFLYQNYIDNSNVPLDPIYYDDVTYNLDDTVPSAYRTIQITWYGGATDYTIYFSSDEVDSAINGRFGLLLDDGSNETFEDSILMAIDSTYYDDVKQAIELDIQANQNTGFGNVLSDFVSIMVSSIGQLATGVAGGIVDMAKALFLTTDVGTGAVTGLSIFGGICAIFAGLSLAVGITTRVYLWITSLGKD